MLPDTSALNVDKRLDLRDTHEGVNASPGQGLLFVAKCLDTPSVACQRNPLFTCCYIPVDQPISSGDVAGLLVSERHRD